MADETPVQTIDLGVRCEQCETWYVVKIARGRLADMRETTCPACGGTAFRLNVDGAIVGTELKQ